MIRLFGQHVVNPGFLPDTLGKALNKVEQVRMLADYTGEDIEPEKAAWAVTQAALFVAAVEEQFFPTQRDVLGVQALIVAPAASDEPVTFQSKRCSGSLI